MPRAGPARDVPWTALDLLLYGDSSIGRAAVSKTAGWGFDSLSPCQFYWNEGGVAEWSNAAVLKTVMAQAIGGSNPSLSAKLG